MRNHNALLRSAVVLAALGLPHAASGQAPPEKKAKSYTIGLLPALDYSADKGFGYGIVFQFDDKRSSDYQPYYLSHRVRLQRTTRGIAVPRSWRGPDTVRLGLLRSRFPTLSGQVLLHVRQALSPGERGRAGEGGS